MATLSEEKIKKRKKARLGMGIGLFILSLYVVPYFTGIVLQLMNHHFDMTYAYNYNFIDNVQNLVKDETHTQLGLTVAILGLILVMLYVYVTDTYVMVKNEKQMEITDQIFIPKPSGNGQFGNERFATEDEKAEYFSEIAYCPENPENVYGRNLGVVVEMKKKGDIDYIRCLENDGHTLLIASTRSGKTRRVIIETIFLRAMTGKSIFAFDPKGEVFLYTNPYLKKMKYKIITFDLLNPRKGMHYNFMSLINEAVDQGDIPRAIDYIWDLCSIIVGEVKGEPLWNDGQASVIATAMCLVSMEAPEEYRNMPNVYHFIRTMFREDDYGELYIGKYFETLPEDHPAREIYGIAETAPVKTRGSFVTSALASLKDFTNYNIAEMTSRSDYSLRDICNESTAVFVIVPDEKTTLYKIATMYLSQAYITLTEEARKNGGRVKNEVDFLLDEFAQFPKIPSFGAWMAVGAGRGLRFTLSIQDYQQLEEKYDKAYKTIEGNSQLTLYLRTTNADTQKRLSERLGTYTIETPSVNGSVSGNNMQNASSGSSTNLQSRELLKTAEVGRIESPYALVYNIGKRTSVCNLPDLSKYHANHVLGLGDEEHNKSVMRRRDAERIERTVGKPQYWNTMDLIGSQEKAAQPDEESSYLDENYDEEKL